MKWFGRKSAAPAARLCAPPWLQGDGTGFVQGYEAQLDEVYRRNPVGLRAVRLAAEVRETDGWQLVSMRLLRRRTVRDVAGPWAAVVDFRARMLAA